MLASCITYASITYDIYTYLDSEDTNKDKVRTKPSGCKKYS